MKNTAGKYMYRDANNHKAYSDRLIFEGRLNKIQTFQVLEKYGEGCNDGFIPSQIGLTDLQGSLQSLDSKDWDDDHCWHELVDIEETDEDPNQKGTINWFCATLMTTKWKEVSVEHPLSSEAEKYTGEELELLNEWKLAGLDRKWMQNERTSAGRNRPVEQTKKIVQERYINLFNDGLITDSYMDIDYKIGLTEKGKEYVKAMK
jgi:hypothetical protein